MDTYSAEEVELQLRHMERARNVSEHERRAVLERLSSGEKDDGIFAWVKCPVWRYRLYNVLNLGLIDASTLSRIMKYVLEGEALE